MLYEIDVFDKEALAVDTPRRTLEDAAKGADVLVGLSVDVRATKINEAMKMAAVRALAELAREDVPDAVLRAYGGQPISFGPEYIIPKPFDIRKRKGWTMPETLY